MTIGLPRGFDGRTLLETTMKTGNRVSRDQKGLRLDGLVFSETDFAVVAENLVAFGEADVDHLDLQPAKRLYQNWNAAS